MKYKLRLAVIATGNMLLFIVIALKRGIWPHLWLSVWRGIQADHLAQTRKIIWELKNKGKFTRIRKDGCGCQSRKIDRKPNLKITQNLDANP